MVLMLIKDVIGSLALRVLQVKRKEKKTKHVVLSTNHTTQGFAIVSKNEAALFTDGRYFLQASEQLDDNWTLMKQGLPGVPTWQEYIVNVSVEIHRLQV
jgi:hypothetical protein